MSSRNHWWSGLHNLSLCKLVREMANPLKGKQGSGGGGHLGDFFHHIGVDAKRRKFIRQYKSSEIGKQ